MLTCPRSSLSFHSNAHHHGSLPQQLGMVWDLLLKADPEGPSPIFHAALRHSFHTPTVTPQHVSLQHTWVKKLKAVEGMVPIRCSLVGRLRIAESNRRSCGRRCHDHMRGTLHTSSPGQRTIPLRGKRCGEPESRRSLSTDPRRPIGPVLKINTRPPFFSDNFDPP